MEEKIYLRYFCYIMTLTLSNIQCGLSDVIRKGKWKREEQVTTL